MTRVHRWRLAVLVATLAAVGCGGDDSAGPKQSLTEKDQQHVKQLNDQRADEWGSTNKKKK